MDDQEINIGNIREIARQYDNIYGTLIILIFVRFDKRTKTFF